MNFKPSALDRLIMAVNPKQGVARIRSKAKGEALMNAIGVGNRMSRRYDGGAKGTTMQGWEGANGGGPNSDIEMDFRTLIARSEDLIRNNGFATNAQRIWTEGLIGEGMTGEIRAVNGGQRDRLIKSRTEMWEAWTTDAMEIDHAGVEDWNGIQALITDQWFSGGNTLVIRRRTNDNTTVPFRLQTIEGAHLDTFKTETRPDGSTVIQGVQFSITGRIEGIWVLTQHPGSNRMSGFLSQVKRSEFIPWSEIAHVFSSKRPGQVIGVPRLSNTILTMKDADDWEYAKLKQQMVASCFAALISGEDDAGVTDGNPQIKADDLIDSISPGMIEYVGLDREITTLTPPNANDGNDFLKKLNQKMAAAIGVTYEDLTMDLSNVNFISGRLGRIRQNKMLKRERKMVLIPKCYNKIYKWFEEGAILAGGQLGRTSMDWTVPVPELTDPKAEGDAINDRVRRGNLSDQDAVRAYGGNPKKILEDKQKWNKELDEKGIVLDSDPRKVSGAGQLQSESNAVEEVRKIREVNDSGQAWLGKVIGDDNTAEVWRFQKGKNPEFVSNIDQ